MKKIVLLTTCLLWVVTCDWSPLSSPFLLDYPCTNTNKITSLFEPGVSLKVETRYSISIDELYTANSEMRIEFDSEAYLTLLIKTDDKKFLRTTMQHGAVFRFRYFVPISGESFVVSSYVPGIVPYITSIKINDVEYCEEPNVGYLNTYVVQTLLNDEEKNCGRRQVIGTELMVNGASTKPGDWPWHAAIYKLKRNIIKYICGGTFISKHFVLTAAHCVSVRGSALLPEMLSVVLGKYNLIGGDIGSKEKEVYKIILHQHFEPRKLDNDIALIELNTEVTYSDYIQPSCLWYKEAVQKLPTNTIMGTVVGWGFDIHGTLSRQLKQAKMPIVKDKTALKVIHYFMVTPKMKINFVRDSITQCCKITLGTPACNGDSGGALIVFVPDESEVSNLNATGTWHVKGIVSATLSQTDRPVCDPEQYIVFTDVEKYRVWIKSYLKEKVNGDV